MKTTKIINVTFPLFLSLILSMNLSVYASSESPDSEGGGNVSKLVGEEITFGRFEQDNNLENGVEDIEWIVLEEKEDYYIALSKYCLECMQYSSRDDVFDEEGNYRDVTYENSLIREWLNGEFLKQAFSSNEREKLLTTDTGDAVMLLGLRTIQELYPEYEMQIMELSRNDDGTGLEIMSSVESDFEPLRASFTPYARQQAIDIEAYTDYSEMELEDGDSTAWYWIGDNGAMKAHKLVVLSKGNMWESPAYAKNGVRPVILIKK